MRQIWLRIQRVMAAKSHAKVDRMEDPSEMVNQLLREKLSAVGAAKLALARAKVWQKQLEDQQVKIHHEMTRYQHMATEALQDTREDMARQALSKKKDCERRLNETQRQLDQAAKLRQRQEAALDKLQDSLRELRDRREALIQRDLFTKAAAGMTQIDDGFEEPTDVVLERMESKVSYRESEIEALLDSERPTEDQQLANYQRDRELDLELQQLKLSLSAS